jgi:hypothetical protein
MSSTPLPQTLAALRTWAYKNKGNETVSGAVNDSFINFTNATLQTDVDVNYAQRMMPLALEFQRGAQGIATEADLRRIAAEGGILSDLTSKQGDIQKDLTNINVGGTKYVADKQLAANRAMARSNVQSSRITGRASLGVAGKQLKGDKYAADRQVDATRIGADATVRVADRQLEGTRYSADRQLDATRIGADADRYGYDRQLEGTRDTNRSQEEQRRIQGDEDRKTLVQGTDETLRLRADARGAIAAKGRRFYG